MNEIKMKLFEQEQEQERSKTSSALIRFDKDLSTIWNERERESEREMHPNENQSINETFEFKTHRTHNKKTRTKLRERNDRSFQNSVPMFLVRSFFSVSFEIFVHSPLSASSVLVFIVGSR